MNWIRTNKNLARLWAVENFERKHGNASVFMPGESCLDIVEALNTGLIVTRYDRIIVVERDPIIMEKIKSKLEVELKLNNVYYHCGELHTLDLVDAAPFEQVSYMYLDTCSNLNPNIALWLANLPYGIFSDDAKVILNFSFPRGRRPDWIYNNFAKYNDPTNWFKSGDKYCPDKGFILIQDGEVDSLSHACWQVRWALRTYVSAVMDLAGMTYKFNPDVAYAYCDTTWMFQMEFLVDGISSPHVKDRNRIMGLLPTFKKGQMMSTQKSRKMVVAGYKSHITKKLNEQLSQRGLTSRQIAGYRAAATVKMMKLA